MRKYQKAAVVMAMLGSVSFLGAGVGHAGDDGKFKADNKQNQHCSGDESYEGLVGIDDVNVGVAAILGFTKNDQSEHKSVKCTQVFSLGK